jgi:tetratricopeptide (TPR) repeat protein
VAELFSLDFVASRADMRRLIDNEPENPLGYLFESGILWWQASAEYGLFKDTPTLQGLFEADVDACVEKAKPLLDSKDPKARTEGLFASGMCYGVRGQWDIARGKYLKAYRDGKKSMKYLRKCVKESPEFHDAYLGLGIFDYQTDRLPAVLKLSAIFIARGDAELGKKRMRQAAEKGKLVARQAEIFLMSLLITDEKDYPGALRLLDSLLQAYPKSPYFHFIRAMLLHKLGREDDSLRQGRALFALTASDQEILGRKQLAMFCGLTGPDCLKPGALRAANAWLVDAQGAAWQDFVATSRLPPKARAAADKEIEAWITTLQLYQAIVWDMLGERSAAQQQYKGVLARPDYQGSRARARACLDAPCDQAFVSRKLKELSLADAAVSEPPPKAGRAGADKDGEAE